MNWNSTGRGRHFENGLCELLRQLAHWHHTRDAWRAEINPGWQVTDLKVRKSVTTITAKLRACRALACSWTVVRNLPGRSQTIDPNQSRQAFLDRTNAMAQHSLKSFMYFSCSTYWIELTNARKNGDPKLRSFEEVPNVEMDHRHAPKQPETLEKPINIFFRQVTS